MGDKIERILGRIFLVFISVLIVIFATEYYFYKYDQFETAKSMGIDSYISEDSHWPRPYVVAAHKYGGDQSDINSQGYIGKLPTLVKPKDEYRIFLLGGSVLVLRPSSIAENLEQQLKKVTNKNVRVFNLGVPSSVSQQDLVRILIDVPGYEPDLIIHFGGGNEITYGPDPRVNYPHRFFLTEVDPLLSLENNQHPYVKTLIANSYFFRKKFPDFVYETLIGDLFNGYDQYNQGNPEYRNLKTIAYLKNLRLAKMISEDLGSEFLAFFQPLVYYKTPSEEENRFYQKVEEYQIWREEIRASVNASAVKDYFVDISGMFENEPGTIFRDQIHFDDIRTNLAVAKQMLPAVVNKIKSQSIKPRISAIPPSEFFRLVRSEKEAP